MVRGVNEDYYAKDYFGKWTKSWWSVACRKQVCRTSMTMEQTSQKIRTRIFSQEIVWSAQSMQIFYKRRFNHKKYLTDYSDGYNSNRLKETTIFDN